MRRRLLTPMLVATLLSGCAGGGASLGGGQVTMAESVSGGAGFAVPVMSVQGRRFASTVRQRFDYSCGSAVLATLLTHHYGIPTDEETVFRGMFETGDQRASSARDSRCSTCSATWPGLGLRSNGFRIPLDRVAELGVPAVALINNDGYRHFVLVRGLDGDRVLIADPNLGGRVLTRARFEAMWNGVLFVVQDRVALARATFGRAEDWAVRPRAPVDATRGLQGLERTGLSFPDQRFF
jgi:predicted double-glycine peptidase